MELRQIMIAVSIVAACIAAVFWLFSSLTRVKAMPSGQVSPYGPQLIDDNGYDYVATVAVQSRRSALAAAAAAVAAACQAYVAYLDGFS